MSKFKFQNQADTIIEWYNQGKSYAEIARLLQTDDFKNTVQNVRRLLRNRLGDIHGHPKVVITEEVKLQIKHLLEAGKSPKQISDLLSIKYPTLVGYLRLQGYNFLPNPGEFIKSEIGNSHELLEIRRPSGFDETKMIHHIRLSMSNPQIVHGIMKYGITPRKSLTMENIIENIPVGFRDAFIIGYFDGDGSVHIETKPRKNSHNIMCNDNSLYINIRGTKPFLEGICDHLNIDKSHIYQHDSIPNLAFANKKDTYRFYQCYQYLPFYYKRKHDRFLAKISHPSYDKYKQDQTISSSIA